MSVCTVLVADIPGLGQDQEEASFRGILLVRPVAPSTSALRLPPALVLGSQGWVSEQLFPSYLRTKRTRLEVVREPS